MDEVIGENLKWNQELLYKMIEFAQRAPSVHNVQPWKVKFKENGFFIFQSTNRRLLVGDPHLHDNDVSLGAFIELAAIFLKNEGLDLEVQHDESPQINYQGEVLELRFFIQVKEGSIVKDVLYDQVLKRASYRGLFKYDANFNENLLREIQVEGIELKWFLGPAETKRWADLYDESASQINKNAGYFEELVHWLRFTEKHPQFAEDGLNYRALSLGRGEAFLGRFFFKASVFRFLSRLSSEKFLISEGPQIRSSQGILAVYASKNLNYIEMGRAFVRVWLSLTEKGLSVCPLSSLVDFTVTRKILASLSTSSGIMPLNVFRFGRVADEKSIYFSPRIGIERILIK